MRPDQIVMAVVSFVALPFIFAAIQMTLRDAINFIINGDNNEDLD